MGKFWNGEVTRKKIISSQTYEFIIIIVLDACIFDFLNFYFTRLKSLLKL